jgi:hypothetical protein
MAIAAPKQLAYAYERRAAARELCERARARLRATRRRVDESRPRIDAADRSSAPALEGDNVVPLPAGGLPSGEREQLAVLLDFVQHRAALGEAQGTSTFVEAESLLGQILWDFGADEARPLVEAVLALLRPAQGRTNAVAQPEVDALQNWLARHPS